MAPRHSPIKPITKHSIEYNTGRPHLKMMEYGRNIQKMIDHACSLSDKDERKKAVQAIIAIMGQLNPHLRDVSDFTHKLWAHLFIISDFNLDVDSPYPKPDPVTLARKPKRLKYPCEPIKFKHYGKTIELFIEKAKEMPEGDERNALIELIANMMKKNYLNWNRDSVNDQMIVEHLEELSGGKLGLKDSFTLDATRDILAGITSRKKKRQPLTPGKHQNGGSGRMKRKY